jgi:WD40 repeat protein
VAFSPDGRWIIAGDTDGDVVMWDVETGDILLQADLYEYSVFWSVTPFMDLAVDQTGNTAVTVDPDNIIYLWDLKGALEEKRFTGNQDWVSSVAFTPDSKQLVTGTSPVPTIPKPISLRLWDVDSGEQLRSYEGHMNFIADLAVSSDGRWILSGSGDGTMRMWDLESGEQVQNILAHTFGVFDVSISPDNSTAISGSMAEGQADDGVAVWDLASGEAIHDLRDGENYARQSWFNSDGRTAYFTKNPNFSLIDLQDGEILREFDTTCEFDFVLHPDGKTIICTVFPDLIISRWNLETEQIIQVFGSPTGGDRDQVELSPDGRILLTSVFNAGTLRLWDVESGEELLRFNSNCPNLNLAISPDGKYAATCGPYDDAILWDLTLPLAVDEVLEWISANRYTRELTCEERARYGVTPLCEVEGS